MEAIEADTVADVEAFCFVAAPWKDVRSNKKFANGKVGDCAAVVVVVEDDVAEVVLASALLGEACGFGFTGGLARDFPDAGAGNDFGGFVIGFNEEGIEAFLAERD